MSIIDIIIKMPWWYVLIIIVFSLYYAIRGIIGKIVKNKNNKNYSRTQKIIIDYIQEFLFKVTITISSFLALLIANYILSSLKSVNDISAGTAILLIFLIFWGVTGASGYLTLLIASGKFPSLK